MSVNGERPGVYSSVEVTGAFSGGRKGRTVGLAAVAASGKKGECVKLSSYGQALENFGADCPMTELARILFLNGAGTVQAVPAAVGASDTADYAGAFAALMDREDVTIMVCDSVSAQVHGAMRQAIMTGSENSKYRIGVVEGPFDVDDAADSAKALNCERMVMVCPASQKSSSSGSETAAALAGVIASCTDPALPLNGAELLGADECDRCFTDAEVSELVAAGVTPVEKSGQAVYAVRGVTTRTSTAGEDDATWRELTTVLIIDDVIPSVRSALRVKFPRVKNTAQTRGAIRTQVIIELENKLKQEIIESYDSVTAEADQKDPTICVVGFSFTVAHGLNRVRLTAHISV